MAIIDEIERTEQGIAKTCALAPGLESYQKRLSSSSSIESGRAP